MATVYSLSWKVYGRSYVANVAHVVASDPLVIYLRGSVRSDNVVARNVEIDARLTSGPLVINIDGVSINIPAGGYMSKNIAGIADRVIVSGGVLSDVVSLNFYSEPQTEWR